MRASLLVLGLMALLADSALAEGIKDPPNYGTFPPPKTQATNDPSRPTTTRNIPSNALPSGVAVQGVYRDGKLKTIAR
jgi:hypothetical protein